MRRIFTLSVIVFALMFSYAYPRDLDGKYTNSALKPWFDHLASDLGLCCSFADGIKIDDPDWESRDGHYRVRLNSQWYDVEDKAVIKEPNLAGPTMVWPVMNDGKVVYIRCFIVGAEG